MTTEERFIAELKDILAFRFVCKACSALVGLDPVDTKRLPDQCPNPNCNKKWITEPSVPAGTINRLLAAAHEWRIVEKDAPFGFGLEYKQPKQG